MLKKTLVLLLIVAIGAGVTYAMLFHSTKREVESVRGKLAATEAKATNTVALIESKDEVIKSKEQTVGILETKVVQLAKFVTNSTAELQSARDAAYVAEAKLAAIREREEEQKNILAQCPAPQVSGTIEKTYVFPKVLDRGGRVLALDAKFGKISGRHLSFWTGSTSAITVDVDEIHPAIITYLSIDSNEAKAVQQRMDIAENNMRIALRQRQLEDARLQQEAREAAERLAIQRAEAQSVIEKNLAEQRAKDEYAANERTKADAAMIQARAISGGAMAPVINNVNQNANTVLVPVYRRY